VEKTETAVKICGVTRLEDADLACGSGADFLGFIFVKGTPRALTGEAAGDIIKRLPEASRRKARMVALFRDADMREVAEIVSSCGFDLVQLHGGETPEYCRELKETLAGSGSGEVGIMKVFKVGEGILPAGEHIYADYDAADYFVFDTFDPDTAGGTGERFNWDVVARERERISKPFFVAGGLEPSNVADAVRATRPYGVDVSSGVETSPGEKDGQLIKEFIENAKKA